MLKNYNTKNVVLSFWKNLRLIYMYQLMASMECLYFLYKAFIEKNNYIAYYTLYLHIHVDIPKITNEL